MTKSGPFIETEINEVLEIRVYSGIPGNKIENYLFPSDWMRDNLYNDTVHPFGLKVLC